MELQEPPATYLFKIWPWIETNKVRIASGAGIILVAAGLISFYSWQQEQKANAASDAFTQLIISDPRGETAVHQADLFLKIAQSYPNTTAGQRAFFQSATLLFQAGQYADAQTRFEQFLGQYPDNFFAGQAALGLAASLDAQGKMDLAAAAYQRVINNYPDPLVANFAKYSLAQIDEHQGKSTEALNLYEEVARSYPNSSLGSEAGMHAMELKTKLPPAPPAATTTAPFNLKP